jgi:transposase InsO family protein
MPKIVKIIRIFDGPHILHSDNGGEFVNNILEALAEKLQIRLAHGKPYNPKEQVRSASYGNY